MSKPISGKHGTAFKGSGYTEKLCDLGQWSVDLKATLNAYASNCTGGFNRKVVGNEDWSGSIELFITPESKAQFVPGGEYSVRLQLDDGNYIQGPIVIGSAPIAVNVRDGAPVSVTYAFEGDGPYTLAGVFAEGAPDCCNESSSGA